MSKTIIPTLTRTHQRLILDNEKLRCANAKVVANTEYHEGDLLYFIDVNTVSTSSSDTLQFEVLCGQNVTAEEATIKANNGIEIPIYIGGVFNIEAIKVKGEYLNPEFYDQVRMIASNYRFEITKMGN